MKSINLFFIFLLLAACTALPPKQEQQQPPAENQFLSNPTFCNTDADCMCGGIDKQTSKCFVGNKLYASKNVNMAQDCPDFCTGIAGNFETKCVEHECKNVKREQPGAAEKPQQIMCTQEAKQCPDGSYVGRSGPNCDFAPCPEAKTDLSTAHWQCEDGSWKQTPEDCFENYCTSKGDCQLMGVKGPCGPYMIGGPTKSLHKPPVFYADRCGTTPCSEVSPCTKPAQVGITGFDCVDTKCVVRYGQAFY